MGGTYTLNEYQDDAQQTAQYPESVALDYLVAGLAAEAGEVAGKWAKHLRQDASSGSDSTVANALRDALISEIGDVLWFCAMLAHELDISLADVARVNISKLADRQARGKIKGSGDER